ncbi:hypothetical protein IQ255_24665 [Pleurocapsales cyanobacterium LEGE 10410]|nr:hypothetical protein [Pleurocapsales cyanobacterium LEGE 10410]
MYQITKDLAGEVCFCPNFFQIKARINYLIERYLSCEQLCDRPKSNPYWDLYQHGLHRVVTEYGAVCLYLWLMSHTTGSIQQVLAELLQDEVNHLTKFWGMGMWLYPDAAEQLIRYLLSQIHTILPLSYETTLRPESNLKSTFKRTMAVLNWQSWSALSRGELIYTFMLILKRMWYWSGQLTPEYLQSCCASPEFFGNNKMKYDQFKINVL